MTLRLNLPLLVRVITIVIICGVLSIFSPAFLSAQNILNIIRIGSILVILSAGLTLTVLLGGIDLSVGAVLSLGGCITATLIRSGYPLFISIAGGIGAGVLCGLINGSLITFIGIPPFIATYGMLWIAEGWALILMKAEIIYGFSPQFRFIGAGYIMDIPFPIILMIAVSVIMLFILYRTIFGRSIYALGANPSSAIISGVKHKRLQILCYTLSGGFAAISGIIYVSRMNAAEAGVGSPMLLLALAAVVMGGNSLLGGEGGILRTVIGAIIIALVQNMLNLMGIHPYWQNFVLGVILIAAVTGDLLRTK